MTKKELDAVYDSGYKNGFEAGYAEGVSQLQNSLHAEHICPSCKYYKTEKCEACGSDFDLFKFRGKERDNA